MWVLGLVLGCGGDDSGKVPAPVDSGEVVTLPEEACRDGGFESTPIAWGLPAGYGARSFDSLGSSSAECDGGSFPAFGLADLDGDGLTDVVVTEVCGGDVGTSRWTVHRNRGDHFAASATEWTLPGGYGDGAFTALGSASVSGCDTAEKPAYELRDLTGDGLVDLVVTQACEDLVGRNKWRVYANTGSGFASTMIEYTLPTGFGTGAFPSTSGAAFRGCDNEVLPAYFVDDLNGDGFADMAITEVCDDAVGRLHWLVYQGRADRFASGADQWSLPGGFGASAFPAASAEAATCGATVVPAFTLADMDADHRKDLVITDACGGGVGDSAWDVHVNTGDRFREGGASWQLPTGYASASFESPSRASASGCAPAAPAFSLTDLDGDERSDLVVTADCGSQVGTNFWSVSPNTGADFGSTSHWEVPAGQAEGTWDALSGAVSCDGGDPYSYAVLDLTGDGALDLVVYESCEGAQGVLQWDVYPGACGI